MGKISDVEKIRHVIIGVGIKNFLKTTSTMFFIYYRKVSVIYSGHLRGPSSLVDVNSAYDKFSYIPADYKHIYNATRIK